MKILVVCGAGASSTFVAQRVQRAADADGFDCTVAATTLSSLPDQLAGCDLVLVGPHLRDRYDEINRDAVALQTRTAQLPADVFGDLDGSRTLSLARDAASSDLFPQPSITTAPREDPS